MKNRYCSYCNGRLLTLYFRKGSGGKRWFKATKKNEQWMICDNCKNVDLINPKLKLECIE